MQLEFDIFALQITERLILWVHYIIILKNGISVVEERWNHQEIRAEDKFTCVNQKRISIVVRLYLWIDSGSFADIKNLYDSYCRKSNCPYIEFFTFHKIMPFSTDVSRWIFDSYVDGESNHKFIQNSSISSRYYACLF